MKLSSSKNTIAKADIALDVLDKYDLQNSDISFRQVFQEIITRWKQELQ